MFAEVTENAAEIEATGTTQLRVSLHIGSTKTGSSALQHILYANRAALEEAGVLYPDIGIVSNAHHALLGSIHPGAWALHKDRYDIEKFDYFRRGVGQAIEQALAKDCKHLVLSSEYFWGHFGPNVYATVREALSGCSVRVFCCLRDVRHWRESSYPQALKNGEMRDYKVWYA